MANNKMIKKSKEEVVFLHIQMVGIEFAIQLILKKAKQNFLKLMEDI